MSSPDIHKYLGIVEASPKIVSEGEAIRFAKACLSTFPEYESLLNTAASRYSKFSDSNGGQSKAYPDKKTFEVKHDQIKEMFLIFVGVSLMQRLEGVRIAVTVKTDTDGKYHYFSDAVKGMRYRETIEKAFNAKKGVRAKGYFLLTDDRLMLPLLALANK
jgi:hypothetical protein